MKKTAIPAVFTLGNLICGAIGIAFLVEYDSRYLPHATIMIFIAFIFDVLDGLVARLFKATSDFGKQLDSLADMVSFGVLPAILMYRLLKLFIGQAKIHSEGGTEVVLSVDLLTEPVLFVPFALVVGAAIRLAMFNTQDDKEFKGLPTPAVGLFVASLPWVIFQEGLFSSFASSNALMITCIILAILMILPIRMINLKPVPGDMKKSLASLAFLAISSLLIVLLRWEAVPIIVSLYFVISLVASFFHKSTQ